jgi:hypothetical protein
MKTLLSILLVLETAVLLAQVPKAIQRVTLRDTADEVMVSDPATMYRARLFLEGDKLCCEFYTPDGKAAYVVSGPDFSK